MGVVTFNKVPTTRFGIEVASPPQYIIAEEDYTEAHVLGLNGDRLIRWGSFKNVKIKYVCTFLAGDYESISLGDANGDGTITAADASYLLRYISGLFPSDSLPNEQQLQAMDVDQDGEVTETDAAMILNSIVGLVNLSDYKISRTLYEKIGNAINVWLHPYYSQKEKELLYKKYSISGIFEHDKDGYFRLEDTYYPATYRKVICKDSITIENVWDQGGAFELPFTCVPGRFYKVGEKWLDASVDTPTNKWTLENKELRANHYWDNSIKRYVLYNVTSNISRPIIRMFFDSSTFNSDTLPTTGQIKFISRRGTIVEFTSVRFRMSRLSYAEPFVVYFDFETCKAYMMHSGDQTPITKSRLDSAQNDDSQLVDLANTASIESFNDRVTTEFPFTRDTGVLYPDENEIEIRFWGRNELYDNYRAFEILPRWWTL